MTEGGGGGKNCQNIDYVICERPLSYMKGNPLVAKRKKVNIKGI